MKSITLACAAALAMTATAAPALASSGASPPVTCAAGPDCQLKWSRAIAWVSQTSNFGVHIQTEHLIQTNGPSERNALYPAFTVNKLDNGDGTFSIQMSMRCESWVGCDPDVKAAVADFVRTLTADR